MRYLFINVTAGYGSTGRIAADQCRALTAQGHTCVLAYGRMAANCDDLTTVRIGSDLDNRLHVLESRILDNAGFCSRQATKKFLLWEVYYAPDEI